MSESESGGLSIKAIRDIYPNMRKSENSNYSGKYEDDEFGSDDCCFGKCTKHRCIGGYCLYGKFKNRFDCAMCSFATIGTLSLFFAIIVPIILNLVIEGILNDQVVIDSTSAPNYDAWQTNTGSDGVSVAYNIRFFDLQNPEETLSGATPIVTEMGPYAFKEYYNKFDIKWTDGGDTVTYNTQKFYVYDPSNTVAGLSLDDKLTLAYPTVLGLEYLLGELSESDAAMISALVDQLFEYKLKSYFTTLNTKLAALKLTCRAFATEITQLQQDVTYINNNITAFVASSNGIELLTKSLLCGTENLTPYWKVEPAKAYFGWLNDPLLMEVEQLILAISAKTGKPIPWTNSVPGAAINWTSVEDTRRRRTPDTMKTGKKNVKEVSRYVYYQNMSLSYTCVSPMSSPQVPYFNDSTMFPACAHFQSDWNESTADSKGFTLAFATDYANRVKGTDANMFGRPVDTDKVQVFISDIYRSAFMEFKEDVFDWYDVKLRRYSLQPRDLLNATENPVNAQYYNFAPSGMENVSHAVGAPCFVSFPHFYLADPSLVSAVRGLSPNELIHSSYLDIEPQSGLLARARKRLQANYYLGDQMFPNLNEAVVVETGKAYKDCTQVDTDCASTLDCEGMKPKIGFMQCLSTKADWHFQDGGVYLPYAWAEESLTLTEDDANSLKDSLFAIESATSAMRLWFLTLAGASLAIVIAMMFARDYFVNSDDSDNSDYHAVSGHMHANNDQFKSPLLVKDDHEIVT